MKRLIIVPILVCQFLSGFTQTTEAEEQLKTIREDSVNGWKKGGVISTGFSQAAFTNWAAGGLNSVAINGLLSIYANNKSGNMTWDNTLDIGYGLLKQGESEMFIKTDDKIDFSSKFGQKASKKWYYAGLVGLKTQLTSGYKYPNDSVAISGLFAPAYVLVAIGMDFKPTSKFSMFVTPLTAKMTFVGDTDLANAGAFGVEPAQLDVNDNIIQEGKKFRGEFGGYLKMAYSSEIMDNVTLQSKVDFFTNYKENPQNIDVNWETLLSLKVNKYITTTLATHLIYDDDTKVDVDENGDGTIDSTGPRAQFKEVLSVGFSYQF